MRAGAEPRLPPLLSPVPSEIVTALNEGRGRAPATTPRCCVWEHYATFSRSAGCRYMFPVIVCQGSLRVRSGAAISG